MLVAIIPAATVAGVVAAAAVEKLFFAVVGIVVFLYLFLSVGGSFERKFGFLSQNPWATVLAVAAAAAVLGLGGRLSWRQPLRSTTRRAHEQNGSAGKAPFRWSVYGA